MKRTTVLLPDDVARLVELEAERRHVTASVVVRDAVARYVSGPATQGSRPTFAALVGQGEAAAEVAHHVDELLAEMTDNLAERNGLGPRHR